MGCCDVMAYHDDGVLGDAAADEAAGEVGDDVLLQPAPQRPRAVDRVVRLAHRKVERRICAGQSSASVIGQQLVQ